MLLEEGNIVEARLDRSSNRNRSARVHGGRQLRAWFHANFKVQDEVDVEFISPDVIRLDIPTELGLFRRYDWHRLTRRQIDKYGEYFLKMELTLCGLDLYSPEIDAPETSILVRIGPGAFHEIQVKTVRGFKSLIFEKERFQPRENLFAAIVVLELFQPPKLYIIPSPAWSEPNDLLFSTDYKGMQSSPKWGVNLSRKNLPLLDAYTFERMAGGWVRSSS